MTRQRRWMVGIATTLAMAALPSAAVSAPIDWQRAVEDPPIRGGLQTEVVTPDRAERDLQPPPRTRFVPPAATTTEHTRLGLSAWITPGAPFERHENPGGVAVGFTVAWPPPAPSAAPR